MSWAWREAHLFVRLAVKILRSRLENFMVHYASIVGACAMDSR